MQQLGSTRLEARGLSDGSDQALAGRAAQGDAAAFAGLIERHYGRIHRIAWRLTGTSTDAEDVAQDVCVKLASAIRTFRGEAEVSTWIWRITYNAATDLLRARRRVQPLGPSEMMMLVDRAGCDLPERDVEGDELWQTVSRLPGQQRDAVMLVYGEDMSHAEAAAVMGCTEKTVSWHLHAARKRLKTMLEPVG